MSVTLSDLTRGAEFLEKTLYYCEKKHIFNCVSISARIGHSPDDNLVYWSLRALVLKYPLLFSRLCGEGHNVKFSPLEFVRFRDVYEVNRDVDRCFKEDGADTKVLTEEAFSRSHAQGLPMWKVVYYEKTGWLSFYASHAFTDGGSVVAYLKEFVEGLNISQPKRSSEYVFVLKDDLPLLKYETSPGFFKRVSYETSTATRLFTYALKTAVTCWPSRVPQIMEKKRFESFFVERPSVSFNSSDFYESSYLINSDSGLIQTAPSFINIGTEVVQVIVDKCRQNRVKLQSYILFVYVHTINTLYPKLYGTKNLKTSVAASFRNRFDSLQSHNSYLGNSGRFDDGLYTYAATYVLEPKTVFSWDTVRKYHNFLHEKVSSEDWVRQYYIADQTMSAEDYLGHRIGREKDRLFLSSTNLGHMDVLEYDDPKKFQILDILFAPSSGALMGAHHMTVSSTKKGGLNVGLNKGDPNISDWATFTAAFKNNLVEFAQ